MLNRPLRLPEGLPREQQIDVESFCQAAIRRSGLTEYGYLDSDDLLAELIAFCWQISSDFDPKRASFSTFAGGRIKRFIIDWKRSDYRTRWVFKGRIYERPRPELVSYEALTTDYISKTGDLRERERGELARAVTRQFVDVADDRSPDLVRALRAGSRTATREADPLGEASTREAA